MSIDQIITLAINVSPFAIVKVFVIIGIILYCIFSFVIVRQVQLMANVIEGVTPHAIKLVAYIHAVAAVVLLIIALLIL